MWNKQLASEPGSEKTIQVGVRFTSGLGKKGISAERESKWSAGAKVDRNFNGIYFLLVLSQSIGEYAQNTQQPLRKLFATCSRAHVVFYTALCIYYLYVRPCLNSREK